MSKRTRALILGATLAAMNLALALAGALAVLAAKRAGRSVRIRHAA
jgi:hypothetical protein